MPAVRFANLRRLDWRMASKRKTKHQGVVPDLQPRHEHVGRELTIPYDRLYRHMHGFFKDLERAEEEYRQEVKAIREKLGVPAVYTETRDVERYSLAVQVFAAFTIEALMSFYAVLRFGGQNYDKYFTEGGAANRLQRALEQAGIAVADDAEILCVVRRVMKGRHPIVHPFTVEYSGTDQATIQRPDRPGPDESAAGARKAVADVDRFLELLREADPPHSHFFVIP